MTPDEIKAELDQAKLDLEKERQALKEALASKADLEAKVLDGTASKAIKGSYKGHTFADGHKLVRNNKGELCDTTKLLASAADKKADGHADAVAVLDWLIEIKYAYFTK